VIEAERKTLVFATHKLIYCIRNKKELPDEREESIIVPVHKKGDKAVAIVIGYYCCPLHTKLCRTSLAQS
jgi:hypothetical protein